MNKQESRREAVIDMVKEVLYVIVVAALSFVYWLAVLLLASLFLVNVWNVSFEQILQISTVLTLVTGILYCIHRVRKRIKVKQ